jgi:phage portal protein BeeE
MGILDQATKFAANFALAKSNGERAFVPGEAAYPWMYEFWGVDTSGASPDNYGNYLSQSSPVFSIVTNRAAMLASLPLRLYTLSERTSSFNVPRNSPEYVLRNIEKELSALEQRVLGARPFTAHLLNPLMNARSPLDLMGHQRRMGLEEVSTGPIVKLLRHVNPHWSQAKLWRMTSMALDIYGQCYWFLERGESGNGTPTEIWWAKPTQVMPVTDPEQYIKGYWYLPVDGGPAIWFETSEVIRILHPDIKDEFQPLSPITPSKIYADHENTSMQSNMNLHKQGLSPGALITPKGNKIWTEDQARAIEDGINARMGGYDKAHRWAVFRQEVTKYDTSISPRDSEFVTGMDYDTTKVANNYHWPVDLLGGKRTYENIDQALKQAWQTVVLHGGYIAGEITEYLLPMFPRANIDLLFFDHTAVAVLQESETTRWERERTQIDLVITRNEWRSERGLEPQKGADQLFASNQQTPLDQPVFVTDQAVQGDAPAPKEDDPNFSTNGTAKKETSK